MAETHQRHAWNCVGETLPLVFVIDAHDGVTDAIAECSCGQHALLNLLDWAGKHLQERVYTVSELATEPARVFLRNIRSDYCDLTRKAAEVEALGVAASAVSAVLGLSLPDLRVVATEKAHTRRPIWRVDLTEAGATGGHRRLQMPCASP